MTTLETSSRPAKADTPILPQNIILLLATAIGVIAANLYYAQPLVAQISHSLGLSPEYAGLVVTLTQAGYGLGVLLIVPLGDIAESRRLMIIQMSMAVLGLFGLAFAKNLAPYFAAAFITGLGSSVVQVLVPYTAHFAPENRRGQVVGTLMSGLMIGIMLSRPVASLLTDLFNWHAVFVLSAALMTILGAALYTILPPRPPAITGLKYQKLIASMLCILRDTPVLQRRGFYQACLFGAFCLFWTATPLLLAGPEFHLSQTAIAIFALVGVSGAVCAPLAGKAADKGWMRQATMAAMICSSGCFLISHFFEPGSTSALAALVIAAILLDAGISANLVLGQRAIFSLAPELRSRLNGLYIALIFVGGSIGSGLGAWAYARGGWWLTSWVGFSMPAAAFICFLTERKSS